MGLDFNTLRAANAARLPQFKNKQGQPAHDKPDGSDWSPAQWLQALIGEVGEWAEVRLAYENGLLSRSEYEEKSAKELADVQTYLDILALRSLDQLTPYTLMDGSPEHQGNPFEDSVAQLLMRLIAPLGNFANNRKKLDRREYSVETYLPVANKALADASFALEELMREAHCPSPMDGDRVVQANPHGVNLGFACMDKFNEVSERVGSTVRIDADGKGWHHVK